MLLALAASAQEMPYYGLTDTGKELKYTAFLNGKDVGGYITVRVYEEPVLQDSTLTVDYLLNMLDKKGKVHKSAKMMGFGDGLIYTTKYTPEGHLLASDYLFATSGTDRMGYIMKIPREIKVGDTLEGGTSVSKVKIPMFGTVQNTTTLSDLKVVGEKDFTLGDGTNIKCFEIKGHANGEVSREKLDTDMTFLLSPDYGIVMEEADNYLNMGKYTTYVMSITPITK